MKELLRTTLSTATIAGLIASFPFAATASGHTTRPVLLLPPEGYVRSSVNDINDDGIIVGNATLPGSLEPGRALRWDLTGELTELDGLGGVFHNAIAVNSRGDVVGHSQLLNGNMRAARWDQHAAVHELKPLPGHEWSDALDINDAGTVVGISFGNRGQGYEYSAVRWDPSGEVTELETPPGGQDAISTAINDRGEVLGVFDDSTGARRGVRWDREGRATVLANRGGHRDEVVGLADDGTAVGMVYSNTQRELAVRWDRAGRLTALAEEVQVMAIAERGGWVVERRYAGGSQRRDYRHGTLSDLRSPADGVPATARDVNDHGFAVGEYERPQDGGTAAVLWSRDGRPTTLPTPANQPRAWAQKLNDRGDVVGAAGDAAGTWLAVAWPRRHGG